MATVKEITHDSGLAIGTYYTTSVSDPDGAISVTAASGLDGSAFGVEMDYDAGSNFVTLQEDFATLVGTDFRWRYGQCASGVLCYNPKYIRCP